MLILSILLSLFTSVPKDNYNVHFEYTSISRGTPPLAFYHYHVTITNFTNQPFFIAIPRQFNDGVGEQADIYGSQYDNFDDLTGSTIFTFWGNFTYTITIFQVKSKAKITIKDFTVETFDEEVQKKKTGVISYAVFSSIDLGEHTLKDVMEKVDFSKGMVPYTMKDFELRTGVLDLE